MCSSDLSHRISGGMGESMLSHTCARGHNLRGKTGDYVNPGVINLFLNLFVILTMEWDCLRLHGNFARTRVHVPVREADPFLLEFPGNCHNLANHVGVIPVAERDRSQVIGRILANCEGIVFEPAGPRMIGPVSPQQQIQGLLPPLPSRKIDGSLFVAIYDRKDAVSERMDTICCSSQPKNIVEGQVLKTGQLNQ